MGAFFGEAICIAFAVFGVFIELLGHSTLGNLAGEACKVPFILQHFQPAGSDRRYLGDDGRGWSILLQPDAFARGLTLKEILSELKSDMHALQSYLGKCTSSTLRTVQARIIGFREHIFTGSQGAVGQLMLPGSMGVTCQHDLICRSLK